jgi:vancomycin resistance protein YoaR
MKKKMLWERATHFTIAAGLGVLLTAIPVCSFYKSSDTQIPVPVPAGPTVSASSSPAARVDTPLDQSLKNQFVKEREKLRETYKTLQAVPLSSFTTDLGTHNESNRVHNIRLSMNSIQKTVLFPGEIFSFHDTIGDSTNGKLGYKPAAVIIGKEFATDYGGGICQVSSTLFNAVAKANLQVTERHSHSLPVDYVPKGQDATVSYPDLDFKFKNNSLYPIRVETSLQGSKVTCVILQIP